MFELDPETIKALLENGPRIAAAIQSPGDNPLSRMVLDEMAGAAAEQEYGDEESAVRDLIESRPGRMQSRIEDLKGEGLDRTGHDELELRRLMRQQEDLLRRAADEKGIQWEALGWNG